MNLEIDKKLGASYKSKPQKVRIVTEKWIEANMYCPSCGQDSLRAFENNKPVADFYCNQCLEEFELKSKNGKSMEKKIVAASYSSMIERLTAANKPNFFFLAYDNTTWMVNNLVLVPKHFITPEIIQKRKPLPETAKRAGWVGCNIDLSKIPQSGRIYIIKNSNIVPKEEVISKWQATIFLRKKKEKARGWIIDGMNCLDRIPTVTFQLQDVYTFEEELKVKYPDNNFIKDKIRQQLQVLRDKGLLEFKQRGVYKKL